MRQSVVMGNWKMNGSLAQTKALLHTLRQALTNSAIPCVIFPPAVYLSQTQDLLEGSTLAWGAQNVYPANSGPFTGEISALMLLDFNCQYVLVGHSDRRQLFNESEKIIAEKFHHVKDHGIIPVLCVGETLQERQNGCTEQVILQQLQPIAALDKQAFHRCVIAYEPVWAIGTGQTARPEEAQAVHAFIRAQIAEYNQGVEVSIIYGGSVTDKNAATLMAMPDVDGALVGGASLNAQQFVEIVKCIN